MFKKIIALLAAAAIGIFAIPIFVSGEDKPSDWASEQVNEAITKGIVPDELMSSYQTPITREEFCELAVNTILQGMPDITMESHQLAEHGYYAGPVTAEVIASQISAPTFSDTDSVYVKTAYILGIVNGTTETTFSPEKYITRQEAAMLLANYLQACGGGPSGMVYKESQLFADKKDSTKYFAEGRYADFKSIAAWAVEAVDVCWANEVLTGTGNNFEPLGTYTREQAIATINRLPGVFRSTITLRGRVTIPMTTLNAGWSVGKDFVSMAYPAASEVEITEGESAHFQWNDRYRSGVDEIKLYTPDLNQLCLGEMNDGATEGKSFEMARAGKKTVWNFGYMTVTGYDTDALIKYTFKPMKGFAGLDSSGIYYGRDRVRPLKNKLSSKSEGKIYEYYKH